jgi:fumarate hydratase class II
MENQNELLINEAKSNNLAVKSNKQIEEMAKVIENKTKLSIIISTAIAEVLTVEGYSKASDVAREIFEEIEKIICDNTYPDFNSEHKPINVWKSAIGYRALDELKKKYTEGEG